MESKNIRSRNAGHSSASSSSSDESSLNSDEFYLTEGSTAVYRPHVPVASFVEENANASVDPIDDDQARLLSEDTSTTAVGDLDISGGVESMSVGGKERSSSGSEKRSDYLRWEDYFMSIAALSAMRSKDPNTQVGAVIVNEENKIVGTGYNGMPIGCDDSIMPWGKVGDDPLQKKYAFVCHAEMNAVLNKNTHDIRGCIIYTTHFPCNECSKIIIQSRLGHVVYLHNKNPQNPTYIASRRLLDTAGVTYRQYIPSVPNVTINFGVVSNHDNNNDVTHQGGGFLIASP